MINISNIKQFIIWFVFVAFQVLFAQNIILYNKAFTFIYLGFILLLPIGISRNNLLLLGFFTGLVIDIFYNSLGTHMAAATFICFIRPHWINAITPRGGYENVEKPTLKDISLGWFLTYSMPLVLFHVLILFFVEAGGFHLFFSVVFKALMSTFLTVFLLVVVQYLFYSKGKYT